MAEQAIEGELRTIYLVDETDAPLECNVAAEFEYEGQVYLVVTPVDELVRVIRLQPGETEDEESLEELEIEEFAKVASMINEELQRNLKLRIEEKGNELVLVGEIPDDIYDDVEELEVETEEGDEDTLLVLAEIDTGSEIYMVAANSGLILYPALQLENDKARALNGDELAELREVFDEVYAQLEEDDDEGGLGGGAGVED